MPDDVFKRLFDLKEITDTATEENKYYDQKSQLEETIKLSGHRLDEIYQNIFLDIEAKINLKLKAGLDRAVYWQCFWEVK